MVLTIDQLNILIAVGLGIGGWYLVTAWRRRQRHRPTAVEELRANIQERRRESLRRAAATEYRPRK